MLILGATPLWCGIRHAQLILVHLLKKLFFVQHMFVTTMGIFCPEVISFDISLAYCYGFGPFNSQYIENIQIQNYSSKS
jgi:hypothetical protein